VLYPEDIIRFVNYNDRSRQTSIQSTTILFSGFDSILKLYRLDCIIHPTRLPMSLVGNYDSRASEYELFLVRPR
jgi:hypothetical protein